VLKFFPYLVELALVTFCLIDCIQTDSAATRNLSKMIWVLLIIFVPVVGPIAWLVAGRPQGQQRRSAAPWPSTKTAGFPEYERPRSPRGPDDDPAFLADLRVTDKDREKLLSAWEQQLKDREEKLRSTEAPVDSPPTDDEPGSTSPTDPSEPRA
jgi:hypothetical protein